MLRLNTFFWWGYLEGVFRRGLKLSIIHVLCLNYSKTKANSTFWLINKVRRMQGNVPSYISKATNDEYQAKNKNIKEMKRDKNRVSLS
jgi:hypothetical protein